MLWLILADPRRGRLGIMSNHRVRKARGAVRPSRPAAGRRQPVRQAPRGSGNCANCPTPLCCCPYSGGKEFPVAADRAGAMLCRTPTVPGRSGDRRSAIPVAGIAEIGVSPTGALQGWTSGWAAGIAGIAGIAEIVAPGGSIDRPAGVGQSCGCWARRPAALLGT
jgi:hypothetical protein